MIEALPLRDLANKPLISDRLATCLGPGAMASKTDLLFACANRLRQLGLPPEAETFAYWIPGRIEVLGKHTDYAGGRSLLTASEKGFCLVAVPRAARSVYAVDAVSGESESFEIDASLVPHTAHWPNFPMTVARRLARNFNGEFRGAQIAFASDLPRASGMSSSSAMLVGFSLALLDLNDIAETPEFGENISDLESLAGYLATIENGQSFGSLAGDSGVGTFGGSEDHTAILCCRIGRLSQYSFCPVRLEREIVLGDDLVLAVGVSGVSADKTGEARFRYNRASRLATEATRIWRDASGLPDPHLAAAMLRCGGSAEQVLQVLRSASHREFEAAELVDRVSQFYRESQVILPDAGDAISQGDLESFGRLVDLSQKLAETLLKNQVPQTVFLAKCARRRGALAASAFGAGFGGSVWALLHCREGPDFLERWAEDYRIQFPNEFERASFFLTRPGPAARVVSSASGSSILETLSSSHR